MDKTKILEVIGDVKNKPNKDLIDARDILSKEFDKTKNLIVELTRHLDSVHEHYEKLNNEIGNRLG